MSSEDTSDEHLTRNKVRSSGVTLSWNKELGSNNPVLASTSQAESLHLPFVQQDKESGVVNISEPADEFLPEEELAWDHSGDIESPPAGLKSPDIVIDTNLENTLNASKWSTGINRALTPDSRNISPERLTQRSRLQGTSSEPDISDQDRLDIEGVNLDAGNLDHTVGDTMDEEAYKKRSVQFKKLFRDVEDSISDFSEQDVFIQNVDSCEPLLAQIKNKFMTLRSSLRDFYDEFDSDAHPDWEEEWEKRLEELSSKFKKNDREVRAKIDKIKTEQAQALATVSRSNSSETPSQNGSTDSESNGALVLARAKIERKDLISCLNELLTQINAVGDSTVLEDFNIIRHLKQSVTWKSDMKTLDKRYVELQKSVVLHPFSEEEETELANLHALVKTQLVSIVDNLEKEDSSRKLYTNSKSYSKDPIPYPLFKAKDDEDVHKFLKEFKEALIRNQIPLKDQVKILRTNLKNFALEVVHKDILDIEVAYKLLLKHFGNSDKIWSAKFRIFLEECEKRWPSGDQNPKEKFQKLSKLISQLEELEGLIASGSVDKAGLYNASSVKKLFSIIPKEISNKVFEKIEDTSTNEDKVKEIKAVMVKFRNTAQQKMLMDMNSDKEPLREKFNYGEQKNLCFFCKEDWDSATHIKEWGVFGCQELLKLSHDDRRTALVKKRLCLACGFSRNSKTSRDSKLHKCRNIATDLKCEGDYNGSQCKFNGLTCKHRKVKSSLKAKIKSKFHFDLQGFNLVIIEDIILTTPHVPAHANLDLDSRIEDLQSGEVAKNMDNKQVQEFFRKRENLSGKDVDKILGIPEGETLFIFCIIKGKTRSLRAFMDCGCSSWLVRNGVPENELKSVKLRDGPIPMFVAGGHTVYATAEWASLLPLNNGCNQIIRGLSVDDVTGPFAEIDMMPIIEELKESAIHSGSPLKKMIMNLKAPQAASGQTDMLLGMKHWNLFPEPLYSSPSGLTLFKNKFLSNGGGELTCIGGPSKALAKMMEQFGACQVMNMFTRISEQPNSFSSSIEYFPTHKDIYDERGYDDICRATYTDTLDSVSEEEESFDLVSVDSSFHDNLSNCEEKSHVIVSECTCCTVKCKSSGEVFASVQSDSRKYLDVQDLGLKLEYRCPSCRNCINCRRGEQYEKVSIRQEAEQCLIRDSIWIDSNLSRAVAKLPFRMNPLDALTNNKGVSIKMLDRVCTKYFRDKEVSELIVKAFKKLQDNGHIKFLEKLSTSELAILKNAPVSYYIPWDVAFSGSISTPARPTFNASKNTPGGTNLNDTLAKGIPNLVNLLHMTLGWIAGPEAISGDISQFYNAVMLHSDHFPYQRFLFRDGLDPSSQLLEGIIVTLIYGVTSVSAQTEELINLIADRIQEKCPNVANFLRRSRYVDDFAKAVESKDEGKSIIHGVETEFEKYSLKVKGWAQSGFKPPDVITKDGNTVTFAGMAWQPQLDIYCLNHPPLHFGQKVRGRLPSNLEVFDPSKGSLAEFVPKKLTRRIITSKLMSRFDLMGKEAPLTLKFKFDLRALIKISPDWDMPVSDEVRNQWIKNFQLMNETRDFWFTRSPVPVDAVDCKQMVVWIKSDAAERGGIMVGVWSSYERRDGSYSCSHLFGRGLLASETLSTPKLELHGLSSAANVKNMVENAIQEWIKVIYVGTDSEISLSWVLYENNKLDVFTRNRASNIRSKVPLETLHWVEGKENLSDTGTRPESVNASTVSPDSEWIQGKAWMHSSYNEALSAGVIKKVSDVQLNHESKKKMKEGLLIEEDIERRIYGFLVRSHHDTASKIAECELSSGYIYPPLKYSFRRTVRTTSLILLAVKKFKLCGLRYKLKQGINVDSNLQKLNDAPVRFRYFPVQEIVPIGTLQTAFHVVGFVTCPADSKKILVDSHRRYFCLSEADLSSGLEYLFKKGTEEVYRYVEKKKIEKVAVLRDGILFFKGRITDEQTLRAIGDLENIVNLGEYTGFNFNVPILHRYLPLALQIATHIHYDILSHKGMETCYRLSLNHAYILQGRAVYRSIVENCVKCKILRKKYLEVEMGPLHETQISISPAFYCTMVDLFGPLRCYCPGYERATRSNTKEYKVWMMVMCCLATGTVNIQVIEKEDTGGVMSGFNRFFSECTVPRMMFPDQGSQLLKALEEMEGMVLDLKYQLSEQRGILFKTCLPQSHSQHGRVERVIRSLKESMEASEVNSMRLTATGWQTVAKGIESAYNNLPLGCYYRRSLEGVSVLNIFTPNLLRGKVSARAPVGLFEVPESPNSMMEKVYRLFNAWYQLWNTIYVPQLLEKQRWFDSSQDLLVDDIVLFKLRQSEMSTEWVLGKVELVRTGRDGQVRECIITYKSIGATDRMLTVERPVREVIKLFNVEDTTLFADIKKARALAEAVIKEEEFCMVDMDTSSTYVSNSCVYEDSTMVVPDMYLKQMEMMNDMKLFDVKMKSSWDV